MHKQRIYIETSVIGGCYDIEFAEWSNKLIESVKSGLLIAVISDVTTSEIEPASIEIKNKLKELPYQYVEFIERNEEWLSTNWNSYSKGGIRKWIRHLIVFNIREILEINL